MDLREKYDTTNPMIAKIIQAKEERLKLLQEMNKQYEEELAPLLDKTNIENSSSVKKKPHKKKITSETYSCVPVRRSGRLSNSGIPSYREIDFVEEKIRNVKSHLTIKTQRVRPPNDYGPMPGIKVGHHWETRIECSYDGIHRPTVAGIHAGPEGAYSIALSGGYPEDVDEGHTFTYTGAGGRDLKGTPNKPKNLRTAPQTKDQELVGVNYSLVRSIETGLPIRVIRGYKSPSVYAPESGYRYDGLYKVVRYWEDVGKTGFRVYRFEMVRLEDQLPAPWEPNFKEELEKVKDDEEENFIDNEEKSENDHELNSTDGNDEKEVDEDGSYKENHTKFSSLINEDIEVEEEIKIYSERLCQISTDFSLIIDSLNTHMEDLSFHGWE